MEKALEPSQFIQSLTSRMNKKEVADRADILSRQSEEWKASFRQHLEEVSFYFFIFFIILITFY
jgi:hypothetical protein